ncbi:hypothetical protein IWW57_005495 [Coemansia sp. S610]|nr:hypothetical protein IWW57_005495 [Coemansia sp. S610]KAJ2698963.1 hypothetical protein H4218_002950 [Coemansia sp. IMI 209128]
MLIFLDTPSRRTLSFNVCNARPLEDLAAQASTLLGYSIAESQTTYITGRHGLCAAETLEQPMPWMCLRGRVLGGKGGFGSTLRSQGSKGAANKPANFDNCRDLYGRRLKTLREAKEIVEKIGADEQAREAAIERRRKKIADGLKESTPKKHLFDDVEYTRNCEEIVESTRLATRRALKRRMEDPSSAASASAVVPLIPLFDGDMSSGSSDSEEEDESKLVDDSDKDKESHAQSESQDNAGNDASSEPAEQAAIEESAKARGKRRK